MTTPPAASPKFSSSSSSPSASSWWSSLFLFFLIIIKSKTAPSHHQHKKQHVHIQHSNSNIVVTKSTAACTLFLRVISFIIFNPTIVSATTTTATALAFHSSALLFANQHSTRRQRHLNNSNIYNNNIIIMLSSTKNLQRHAAHSSSHHDEHCFTMLANESPSIQSLVQQAEALYKSTFHNHVENDIICTVAPGRVNLIGEHTDYTQGFVFPMAIGYSTVCVGTGYISKSTSSTCQIISLSQKPQPRVISFEANSNMVPIPMDHQDSWTNYVAGVVQRYMDDILNKNNHEYSISFQIAIAGNVPLGSGLSSSAALEVSVATFIERLIQNSSETKQYIDHQVYDGVKEKAILCQKAENVFCNSPCGIMDQYVSAAGRAGTALLIDCRSLDFENVEIGSKTIDLDQDKIVDDDSDDYDSREEKKVPTNSFINNSKKPKPVFVICNSNVTHSIGGGEYPIRVAQCKAATEILSKLHGNRIQSLRDATLDDVEMAKKKQIELELSDLIYRRARHVVTENQRTQQAKLALMDSDWKTFGKLMNESHESMKNDYEVSCEEIDILVDIAQSHPGVWGSRLTGGGFGGCTVTLVEKDQVAALCSRLEKEYKALTGKDCFCFETQPGDGSREIILPK